MTADENMSAPSPDAFARIDALVDYATARLALDPRDADWMRNRVLDHLSAHPRALDGDPLDDDGLMGLLSAPPSAVQDRFAFVRDARGGMAAMRWLYDYCVANGSVKRARLERNPRFAGHGLIVTINTAKPEFRDMREAAAANGVEGSFARCTICHANEGLASRGKRTLRTVPVTLGGAPWFWQFSPYGYFDEHGICVNREHTPMHVDEATFARLIDFVDQFPGYFLGCNAALPRIGGSVLAHDHYQGGGLTLPMQTAAPWARFAARDLPQVRVEALRWPATAVRVVGADAHGVVAMCERIRAAWCAYRDPGAGIEPEGPDGPQSSVSPSARVGDRGYEMCVILRNNAVSARYPDGVFHAHPRYHIIKREPIGLIEAQGLFILPGRLVDQLAAFERALAAGDALPSELAGFAMLCDRVLRRGPVRVEGLRALIRDEVAGVCEDILRDVAVFKTDAALERFLTGMGLNRLDAVS